MKKLLSCLLMLALVATLACAAFAQEAARPRIILYTAYLQMGWGDRVDVGCVDEDGGLWFATGDAGALGWPGDVEGQLEWLATSDRLEKQGELDHEALFDLKSLILSAEAQDVKAEPVACDAGTEISRAVRYDDDASEAVLLGMSGDSVGENTDPNAQALYLWLRRTFPGVACFGDEMGPAGFEPVPVADFLKLDAEALRTASIQTLFMDCEAGPSEVKIDDEEAETLRAIALRGVVTGKANAVMVTGGTVSVSFHDANGEYIGGLELYHGLLVRGDGMYTVEVGE